MNVRVHFFGMIAEAVNSSLHIMEHYEGSTLADVEKDLLDLYPQLNQFSYQMALDQKLAHADALLMPENEVAILPPFAGG